MLKSLNKEEKLYVVGLASLISLSATFLVTVLGTKLALEQTTIPDPSRPMTIHSEIVAKYPEYAAGLKQLGVDPQKPDVVQANSYAREKAKANSIEYRLGSCSNLATDWNINLMNRFPRDRHDMKYSRDIPGVPSSPEDVINPDLLGRVGVSVPGRGTFLINASGSKNGVYDTTYISLTCAMP